MMEVTQVSDLDKILGLLKEYTKVLRDTCQRELERRTRLVIRRLLAICIASIATPVVIIYHPFLNDPAVNYPSSAIWGTAVVALSITLILATGRRQYSYDADQVAHTLYRLTEMTSQYSEHATRRIADKFELDLRLAEAEGVLRMYTKIFGSDHLDTYRAHSPESATLPRR